MKLISLVLNDPLYDCNTFNFLRAVIFGEEIMVLVSCSFEVIQGRTI